MYTAVQCDGVALPNFTASVSVTPHTGLFPYASTVSYSCPAGQRFEDGSEVIVVTCTGAGLWDWKSMVTSCGREFQQLYHRHRCSSEMLSEVKPLPSEDVAETEIRRLRMLRGLV